MRQKCLQRMCVSLAGLAAVSLQALAQAPPPSVKLLHNFRTTGLPALGAEVNPGEFLGITEIGAVIFAISSSGKYQTVYTFPPQPQGNDYTPTSPIQALNANAYGVARLSGPVAVGELFSVGAHGAVTTVPYNGIAPTFLVQSPDNQLYTFTGSTGTIAVFSRLDYQGNITPLYTLSAGQGVPYGAFFYGSDGAFYGFNLLPSQVDGGIWRLTRNGSFSWVVPTFPLGKYGLYYPNVVIQAGNGKFYGTTPQGGSANAGTIYEATPDGQFRTLYEFQDLQTGIPETLLQASDGMLYGTARGLFAAGFTGYSSLFRLDPSSGQFKTLLAFKSGFAVQCECGLSQGSDGKLYGSSASGGTYGAGTLFVIDLGLPKPQPVISLFSPKSGVVGQKVLLWGRNLLGATAVSFHGTGATSFVVASGQGVWVQVPSGATTGPITVTTPNGSYTTTQSFTVH